LKLILYACDLLNQESYNIEGNQPTDRSQLGSVCKQSEKVRLGSAKGYDWNS